MVDTVTICAAVSTAGAIVGYAVIPVTLTAVGLSAAGPVAGGYFAQWQSAGLLTAGSNLAILQSFAMTSASQAAWYLSGTTAAAAGIACTYVLNIEEESTWNDFQNIVVTTGDKSQSYFTTAWEATGNAYSYLKESKLVSQVAFPIVSTAFGFSPLVSDLNGLFVYDFTNALVTKESTYPGLQSLAIARAGGLQTVNYAAARGILASIQSDATAEMQRNQVKQEQLSDIGSAGFQTIDSKLVSPFGDLKNTNLTKVREQVGAAVGDASSYLINITGSTLAELQNSNMTNLIETSKATAGATLTYLLNYSWY